ncbi:MAG: glycoside hydrolase family 44 protein, partial [Verrucomicrobiota bacterium]
LENGWQNWGWATLNYSNTSPVHSGSDSISVTMGGWAGIQLYHPNMDSTPYASISFWLNGGSSGGQHLRIYGLLNGSGQSVTSLGSVATNTWQQFTVTLSALGVANHTNFSGFVIQDSAGTGEPTFYLDDISLVATTGTNAPVTIGLDALVNRHSISPFVYGLNWASPSQLLDLNFTINRGGGNASTRHNWLLNASNRASDWFFESLSDGSSTPGDSDDTFIGDTMSAAAEPMITIPIMGWMPKLGTNRSGLCSFSVAKYGAQTATDPWFADAGNGVSAATGLNLTNDPTDANFYTNSVFQQGWLQHLTNRWGASTNGGVNFYILDNELSIWAWTHRDVHPIGAKMEEVRDKVIEYGGMVKSCDPDALICMGEEYGWNGFLNSGYDQQNPGNTDRNAHGGADYMPWLLSQIHSNDVATSRRTIDYFTIHWYPQENNFDDTNDAACLLRNRVTRALWDSNYVDESWINTKIYMIPRMKNWVASNYPGLKIGITEYVYGAVDTINGAIAQADAYGIFGREGLDLSTRWGLPDPSTPTYKAMKMFRNYDGNKSVFGDVSVWTSVPQPDFLSAFGAVRTSDGALTLMVLNKDLTNATPIVAGLSNFPAMGTAQRWQLTSANVISHLADLTVTNGVLGDILPAQSITLFVLPATNSFTVQVDKYNSPGQLGIWINGEAGQTYILQSSTNLIHWTAVSTNQAANNSFELFVPATNAAQFYRAVRNSP